MNLCYTFAFLYYLYELMGLNLHETISPFHHVHVEFLVMLEVVDLILHSCDKV